MNTRSTTTPHVVIIGAGFAGLYAAKALAGRNVRVSIIDRKNHHTFQPLLYQVATAALNPADIAAPIRSIFATARNVEVLLAEVTGIDLQHRSVLMGKDSISYDYLLVATGATHAYFGHPEWAPLAPGLKTLEDATEIRRRILLTFELAERNARLGKPRRPINLIVVGGGPTGVELAGTLAEITNRVLTDDFRSIDPSASRVVLVEAGPRLLATYPEDLSHSAEKQLRELGVEVLTSSPVTEIGRDYVVIGNERLDAALVLWGAGVAASPLGKVLGVPLDRAGRVLVNDDLSIPGYPNVFVLGDLASVKQADGRPVPGVAPAALQMGRYAARTILGEQQGEPRQPFVYRDKGSLATIGRSAAVAELGKLHFSGFFAWMAWLLVHIYFLIGFRNRLQVLWEWAWAYLTFHRGSRLITGQSGSVFPATADQTTEQAAGRKVA